MPNNVLTQLKALRDGVAEELRRDPRYQTLQSLDKSIAEITTVLSSAGLLPPSSQASSLTSRLHGLGPSMDALAEPSGVSTPAQKQAAIAAPPVTNAPKGAAEPPAPTQGTTPDFKEGTVSQPPAAVPETKMSSPLSPATGLAAALIAGGVAAEAAHLHKNAEAQTAQARSHTPKDDAAHDADEDEAVEPSDDVAPEPAQSGHDTSDDEAEDHPQAAKAHGHDDPNDQTEQTKAASDGDSEDFEHPAHARHGRAPGQAHDGTEGEDGEAPKGETDETGASDDEALPPKQSGYVPMAAKPDAAQYAPSIAVKFGKLPNKVDLRPLMTPIEDQGQTSSCVANAVAGAYEYWIKKASKQDHNISRLFVYYNARWRDGSQDKDEGSVIQLAMEGLQKFGACAESAWPFDPRLILKKPGAEAYKEGSPYRVHDMAQVPLKLESWKQALAEGKPIVFGIELFDSFDECTKRGGVVPMPAPDDIARKKHSGHSMCAVGYSDSEKVFIVRNSWGPDFGDKGYCYMPYDYLLNPKFNDADCWIFVPKVPSQPPRETWQDDTTPVTNSGKGVDFEIQPYRVQDYDHIVIDLFEHARRPWNATIDEDYGHYVSAVNKSAFTELESFDVTTLLGTTALLAGVGAGAVLLSESFSSKMSASESATAESLSLYESEESEDDQVEDAEEDADDDADSDNDADADEGEDADDAEDEADEDAEDDAEEDVDDDADDAEDGDDNDDGADDD
jgi:C1A family cysteine protease